MPEDKRKNNYESFEKWIDGMEDTEFDIWYAQEATKKQREFADKVREEAEEDEKDTQDAIYQQRRKSIFDFLRRLLKRN